MKAVVQRVRRAEVRVEGDSVGSIGRGALVLLGVLDLTFDPPLRSRASIRSRSYPSASRRLTSAWPSSSQKAQVIWPEPIQAYADPPVGRSGARVGVALRPFGYLSEGFRLIQRENFALVSK